MTKDTGGQAFPLDLQGLKKWTGSRDMTLRDWFAGQALMGSISNEPVFENPSKAAEWAYEQADAMLTERNKQ